MAVTRRWRLIRSLVMLQAVKRRRKLHLLKQIKSQRSMWVSTYVKHRASAGAMSNQMKVLLSEECDPEHFQDFYRFTKEEFNQLLSLIEVDIATNGSVSRPGIPARTQFMMTLNFLTYGTSQKQLALWFMVGKSTVNVIVHKVIRALCTRLEPLVGLYPDTEEKWQNIVDRFSAKWQYPNCIGALDGKLVRMVKPAKSGSLFFDYGNEFSIILMALVDADYRFIWLNIGSPGKCGDAGIWSRCNFNAKLLDRENNVLNVPADQALPNSDVVTPLHIVSDDAFALTTRVTKPHKPADNRPLHDDQIIFNSRMSRARVVVECTFGQLANRFRALFNRIYLTQKYATNVVLCCTLLHNWIMSNREEVGRRRAYEPDNKKLRLEGLEISNAGNRDRYTSPRVLTDGKKMRDALTRHFVEVDPMPFQYERSSV